MPLLSGRLAFVRNFWPGYRDHCNEVTQAREIVGICRVERQFPGHCRRRDHEVYRPAAGLPARRDHSCRHPALGPGGVRVEGNRVELVLSPLQYVQPASPLIEDW